MHYLQDWFKDEEPESDGRGFYVTQLPVLLFQIVDQNVSCFVLYSINTVMMWDNFYQMTWLYVDTALS